ncbi:MAG: type I methionyl aminopeptidase [Planctomycetota bacterium]|jgi:methionyl aminopeptidase
MVRPEIKSRREIEIMRQAGAIVARALTRVRDMVAPGVTTLELDRAAEEVIREADAVSAFKGYYPPQSPYPFPAVTCISVNEEVVHGIPSARALEEGDLVSVDVGVKYRNYHGDAARTFPVGELGQESQRQLRVCREALTLVEGLVKPKIRLRELCGAVQEHVEGSGFQVVKQFVGHGIGRELHEPPQIPNFVTPSFDMNLVLRPGMALAFEPMVNAGTDDVVCRGGDWPVVTRDGKLSVHFEDTVLVTEDGAEVLTTLDGEV